MELHLPQEYRDLPGKPGVLAEFGLLYNLHINLQSFRSEMAESAMVTASLFSQLLMK